MKSESKSKEEEVAIVAMVTEEEWSQLSQWWQSRKGRRGCNCRNGGKVAREEEVAIVAMVVGLQSYRVYSEYPGGVKL